MNPLSQLATASKMSNQQIDKSVADKTLPQGIAQIAKQSNADVAASKPVAPPPPGTVAGEDIQAAHESLSPLQRLDMAIDMKQESIAKLVNKLQSGDLKSGEVAVGHIKLREDVKELKELQALKAREVRSAAEQMGMGAGVPEAPAGIQALQQAPAPQQGIDAAQSNLPEQGFAGGGILAFAGEEGSLVPDGNTNRMDLMAMTVPELEEVARTNPDQNIRALATQIAEQKSMGTGSDEVSRQGYDSQQGFAVGGVAHYDGTDGSLVDDAALRKQYGISSGSTLGNVGNYINYLQAKGYGEDTGLTKALTQKIQSRYADVDKQEQMAPFLSLAHMGLGMMGTQSPNMLQGIGQAGQAGLGSYIQQQAASEAARNKLLGTEIDLGKLSASERSNLLHYGITGAVSDANMRAKLAEIAANKSGASADRQYSARLGAYNNAFNQIIKAKQDKLGIDKLTDADYQDASDRAGKIADDFIARAGGKNKPIKLD